ncbi:MAG: hypothetical protein Q8J92_07335 [Parvibaculum sp.]|nr:hypothetical protein [Parvibaculum sp.]
MIDALAHPQPLTAGKHNMASAAFAELRAARREGRAPDGAELSFNDLIDTLNPLQHIPVVSEIYRGLTGDAISPQARVAGGALYGGPIGLVVSVASLAIAGGTGEQGIGDQFYAALFNPKTPTGEAPAQIAHAAPATGANMPVALRADAAAGQTASTVPDKSAALPVGGGSTMPQLSSEAFAALIGSFDNPEAIEKGLTAVAPRMSLDMEGADDEDDTAAAPGDILSAMNQALDKYDALKHIR